MGTAAAITSAPSLASQVGTSLTAITSDIQQYVVAPSAAFGLAGYIFNAQGENINQLSADITDHYLEDNTAVQDQIAIRPKRITLKGYVGEVVYNGSNPGVTGVLASVAEKLTNVAAFLPVLSAAATQAQAAALPPITFDNVLSASSNIYGIVQNILGATGNMANQQNAYTYFESLMNSKTLMSIQTPWEFVTNFAIESVVAIQDEKTMFMTDFSITLKQIRIASTGTVISSLLAGTGGTTPPGGITGQGANAVQSQPPVNLGPVQGSATDVTPQSFGATGAW